MNTRKYAADIIRNNLIAVCNCSQCTSPQRKAIKQIVCGLIEKGSTILNQLTCEEEKTTTKKQAEKLGKHLGNVDLTGSINKITLNKIAKYIKDETVIGYDLTDIAKESAEKMEEISEIFDGSKREKANGYTLHGVGISDFLIRLDMHNQNKETLPQRRQKIIEEILKKIGHKGIWAYDRGNDSGDFFRYLNQKKKLRFICRLTKNRNILNKETGEITKITNLTQGRYKIHITERNSNKFDLKNEYLLIINQHLKDKKPIMLLCSTNLENKTDAELVELYLGRWGSTENHYKNVKSLYKLESIRLIKYQRIKNLVALVLLASMLSSLLYKKGKESESPESAYINLEYKKFIKKRSLTFNQHSFGTFFKKMIPKKLRFRVGAKPPNNRFQTTIFEFFEEKLGVI